MSPTGFKDIVWFLVAPAFIVVIFTFGISINCIALRILKTIGYEAKAENCNPGFKVTVFKISNDTPPLE